MTDDINVVTSDSPADSDADRASDTNPAAPQGAAADQVDDSDRDDDAAKPAAEDKPLSKKSPSYRLRKLRGELEQQTLETQAVAKKLREQELETSYWRGRADNSASAKEPDPEDFETTDQFKEAHSDFVIQKYKAEQRGNGSGEPAPADTADVKPTEKQPPSDTATRAWMLDQVVELIDRYPDVNEKLSSPAFMVSGLMVSQLMEMDGTSGGEVAYYLATNPKQSALISRMTDADEIAGKLEQIEQSLGSAGANDGDVHKSFNPAPPPIPSPSKGVNSAPVGKSYEQMSFREYASVRNDSEYRAKGGRV